MYGFSVQDSDGKGYQDFQVNCHNVKVKGEKLKIIPENKGFMAV